MQVHPLRAPSAFVLPEEAEKPEGERTKFVLRPLTAGQRAYLLAVWSLGIEGPQVESVKREAVALAEAARAGILGIENATDADGKPFAWARVRDTVLGEWADVMAREDFARIPDDVVNAIGKEVFSRNLIRPEERGK